MCAISSNLEWMRRIWIVFLIVLSLLSFGALGVVQYLSKDEVTKTKLTAMVLRNVGDKGIPAELADGYDPTKNAPMFVVENVAADQRLQLKVVWPPVKSGYLVDSKITCEDGINDFSGKMLTVEEFVTKVGVMDREQVFFSGICKDQSCTEMISECSVTMGVGKNL